MLRWQNDFAMGLGRMNGRPRRYQEDGGLSEKVDYNIVHGKMIFRNSVQVRPKRRGGDKAINAYHTRKNKKQVKVDPTIRGVPVDPKYEKNFVQLISEYYKEGRKISRNFLERLAEPPADSDLEEDDIPIIKKQESSSSEEDDIPDEDEEDETPMSMMEALQKEREEVIQKEIEAKKSAAKKERMDSFKKKGRALSMFGGALASKEEELEESQKPTRVGSAQSSPPPRSRSVDLPPLSSVDTSYDVRRRVRRPRPMTSTGIPMVVDSRQGAYHSTRKDAYRRISEFNNKDKKGYNKQKRKALEIQSECTSRIASCNSVMSSLGDSRRYKALTGEVNDVMGVLLYNSVTRETIREFSLETFLTYEHKRVMGLCRETDQNAKHLNAVRKLDVFLGGSKRAKEKLTEYEGEEEIQTIIKETTEDVAAVWNQVKRFLERSGSYEDSSTFSPFAYPNPGSVEMARYRSDDSILSKLVFGAGSQGNRDGRPSESTENSARTSSSYKTLFATVDRSELASLLHRYQYEQGSESSLGIP